MELLLFLLLEDDDLELLELLEERLTLEELLDRVLEGLTREEELDREMLPLLFEEELDLSTPDEPLLLDPDDLLTFEELLLPELELLETDPEDLLLELFDLTFPERPLLVDEPLERTLELLFVLPLFVTVEDPLLLLLTLDELRVRFTFPEPLLVSDELEFLLEYRVREFLLSYF